MAPEPVQWWRDPLPDRDPSATGSRRHPAWRAACVGVLALALGVPTVTASAATRQPVSPDPTVAGAGGPRDWIVTLAPDAVAPDGPSVGRTSYRLDTTSGRAAARGRAQRTARVIERLERHRGVRAHRRFAYAMQGFAATMTGAEAAALRADPSVASVVPDAPASIAADSVPLGVERIGADRGVVTGVDLDIDVAVIDTGVGPVGGPLGSPELDIRGGTDCRPGRARPYPDAGSYADGHGHGTHVAGTIAARANGAGIVGVAPGARIWAVRVFDATGSGTTSSVVCGVDWVTRWLAQHPGAPMVVNMSLRGPDEYRSPRACDASGRDPRDPEHQAICTAVRAGAVFAVAAGNESDAASRYIPARYAEVLTVGAISDFDGEPGARSTRSRVTGCSPPTGGERDDRFASYSNRGSAVDVVAPGTCIRSLAPSRGNDIRTAYMSGTSMATPHVAGTIARYLASHPDAAPDVASRLVAAGGLDWVTSTDPALATDPNANPLRLVDAGALLSGSPGLRAWVRRSMITVGKGVAHRTLRLDIQRAGGLWGPVDVRVDGLPTGVGIPGTPSISGVRGDIVLDIDAAATEGDHPIAIRAEAGGVTGEARATLRIDREAPDVTGSLPRITLGRGGTFDGTATVRVAWSATDSGSGVDRVDLQRWGRGTWKRVARSQGSGAVGSGAVGITLGKGSSARFRVVARDRAGNTATSDTLTTRLQVRDSSGSRVAWTGPWRTRHVSSASGRSVRASREAGAQATLRFTGRAVALVAPRGPGRGPIDVSIDGARAVTVDLAASRTQQRRIVYASGALAPGDHVITVRAREAGTELDAILVLE